MSVVLLLKDSFDSDDRSIPVATQATFNADWISGAKALGLEWVPLAATGFDITPENRNEVVAELQRLRGWFSDRGESHAIARLDRLLAEMIALQFEKGATAFFG